ncbi:hypothetical protein G7072_13765 [Nocardioides sp. HDW12B]|uniref:hypothetical protein n=1 Tax=Nocardioides sp. HDW12B TaxID=2714939 RepID=UPI00140AA764|nr:hypothetical protein [Nocardioides sp. HDW12B]QIK67271.1 hypothetical protein G7072_13765 [Nocardioides sp. HDW12B]
MIEELAFAAWSRRGGAGAAPVGGRPTTDVAFELRDDRESVPSLLRFAQPGPADVRALQPGAIRQVVPPPGDRDADEEHCPYVELATEDLPWRYGLTDGGPPRPWLALVVGEPSDVTVAGDRATLGTTTQADHDLVRVRLWAHVQRPRTASAGSGFSRVVSPARLLADRDYVAALVVPWKDGGPAWDGSAPAEVLCLHSWTFRTGAAGTFDDLALQLHAADNDEVGTVKVAFGGEEVEVPGALTTLGFTWDPIEPGSPARDHDVLTVETDRQGREYVQPPAYGDAWVGHAEVRAEVEAARPLPDAQWPWTAQVNADLRVRAIAGVGLQAGIDLQEQIVAAADAQWGQGRWTADLIGSLALGTAAAEAQWRRRLPADPASQLGLLGPAAHRLPVDDHPTATSLAGALGEPEPGSAAYPVGLLGPQVARAVGRDRLRDAGGQVELQQRAAEGLPVPARPKDDIATGADPWEVEAGHLDGLGHRLEQTSGGATSAEEVDRTLRGVLNELEVPIVVDVEPTDPPRRVRPEAVVDVLVAGATSGSARRRVTGRLTGHDDEEPLAPLRDCPDIDLPAWPYVRDVVPHWLLPGAETLGPGEVVAMRTCPEFVEAFLLGLNHRALGELSWRQHPVAVGCTPLRRFWDAAPDDGEPETAGEDVQPVRRWLDGSRLGSHAPAGVRAERLVVVVRSELFRRYPRTLLFLAPHTPGTGFADRKPDLARPVLPRSVSAMGPDLTMFAFDRDPDVVDDHWVVVQEMPEGIRFGRTVTAADSAAWAKANLDKPLRVLLEGPATVGVSG